MYSLYPLIVSIYSTPQMKLFYSSVYLFLLLFCNINQWYPISLKKFYFYSPVWIVMCAIYIMEFNKNIFFMWICMYICIL